jgi:L1 cell adhesion molecule like protein
MVNHFVEEFKRKKKVDISGNPGSLRRLRNSCERAKRILSFAVVATVEENALFQGIDLSSSMTRAKFEDINMDLFEKCMDIVNRCFVDSGIDKSSVDDVVLVGGSSRIPKVKQLLQEFFKGKEICKSINPDEAVAYGAAVQAALLSDGVKSVPYLTLKDVTPLSLGTSLKGDIMSVVIPRNTLIPVKKKAVYYTCEDDQSSVTIDVYEGERMIASENNLLGLFRFSVPRAPRRHLPIRVCFRIDADGILNVSAEEETSGNKKDITITNENGRLSREEIERMIQEAEYFKAQDMKFKEKVKAKNELDDYLYNVTKVMKDDIVSSKLAPVDKVKINAAMIKGKSLIDDYKNEDTCMFVDFLKELETIFESAMNKINKGYSDEESD